MNRRLLAFANPVMAALLLICGLAAIKWPTIVGSRESAATLTGALIGSFAVFVGNQISRWDHRVELKDDLESKRRRVRTALMAELVRIAINHLESAIFFSKATPPLLEANNRGITWSPDCLRYIPPEPVIFHALAPDIICLSEPEIDSLVTLYGNIEVTRAIVRECHERNQAVDYFNAHRIANNMVHDCHLAAEAVERLAPTRKIQRPGEGAVLLSEELRKVRSPSA